MRTCKNLTCLLIPLFFIIALHAQDIIIKQDKTELKSKVMEITETAVKYKKWENPNGPLYNIAKTDVFMIIYSNGQRETFKEYKAKTENIPETYNNGINNNSQPTSSTSMTTLKTLTLDTSIDYKNLKIRYHPSRALYWFSSNSTAIGIQQEVRLVKNVLNLGFSTDFFFVTNASQILYSAYLEPYLPLNRLSGNYKQQDKGLFINAKIGYGSLTTTDLDGSYSSGGVLFGVGADYFFTRSFGVSLSGFKWAESDFNLQAGIALNF